MNITANFRRISLLSCIAAFTLFFLVACSSLAPSTGSLSEDSELSDMRASQEVPIGEAEEGLGLAPEEMETRIINSTRTLHASENNTLGLELISGDDFARLIIQTSEDSLDYQVSRISHPERVVIDILNFQSRLSRVFEVNQMDILQKVRVGAHPEKSRVVLDLYEDQIIAHDVYPSSGDLVITLASNENMQDVLSFLDMSEPSEAMAAPAVELFEEPAINEIDNEDIIIEGEEIAKLPEPAIETQEIVEAQKPRLTDLRLESEEGKGNRIIAAMDSAGFFTLKRTAPSEYVLLLENASFNPDTVQSVLAPPQSGAIRSVRPVANGSDTLLRIFTSPESELSANVSHGNIIVSSKSAIDSLALPEDSRAQLDPNEVTVSDEAEETELVEEEGLDELDSDLSSLLDETPKYTGRLISLDLQDTDIDNALRIIAEVSNLNIIASDDVTGKVTLRLIDVPWDQALDVILKTNGLDKVQEGNVVRIAPVEKLRQEREALKQAQEAEEELEALQVRYMRISYARAADLQPLVETVISERGTVAYDERSNQLIIKDIKRGVQNVVKLVKKLDLRTPQVLLETQIVEAQRTLLRELGAEVGFTHLQTPETGNATGHNFPNSIEVGGSVIGTAPGTVSAFPATGDATGGSAISFLLDSADGVFSLDTRLTALEREGRVRIVSRPAVATTNNTEAEIKSVETIRVKKPSGGTSVATGQGSSASGGSSEPDEIDIGIELRVTPQASPDYYVLLDIYAKSSTVGTVVVDGIPSEIKREATSTVLVSSGQTFAMGGIYKINDQSRINGVPYLKDIPFLGHLFRWSQTDNSDEELIFFITPRIVEGSFDDAAMRVSS